MTDDIFGNEYLIRIWESERKTREFNATLMWENVKHFGGFISALLVAEMAFISYIWSFQNTGIFPFDVRELMFVFPFAIIVLARHAQSDLKERWGRFLLVVTHLLKLELLLGIYDKIDHKLSFFRPDEYLFSEYQKNLSQEASQKFIDKMMKKIGDDGKPNRNTYTSMISVYRSMTAIAVVFIIFGILIFVNNAFHIIT